MKTLKQTLKKLIGKNVNPKTQSDLATLEDLKHSCPQVYYSNLTDNTDWKYKYNYYRRTQDVKENWVLYESHAGAGMLCNPLALFKEFQNRDDFDNYIHIWVIADDSEIEYLRELYKDFENVLFVKYNTIGYAYFVARAKYLINNTSFNAFFAKREEQIYLNTWHSITVKYLGYDMVDGKRFVKNMLRNLLAADYIISPNKFMTDIFNNSFRLREIYSGKYIEEGYPRNDRVIKTERSEIIEKLEKHGTIIDPNKQIILYAPTWNGNSVSNPIIDFGRYSAIAEHFDKNIDTNKYQLLIKPHQIEYRNLTEEQLKSGNFVSYNIDANELLSITDIVITDYSSIYFDFLVSERPILFYIPNLEEYSKTRGIYFTPDQLPGPCATNLYELSDYVNNIDEVEKKYKQALKTTREWACEYDDGNVSQRILDIIFNNNLNYNIKSALKTDKKTILIYPGSFATNGVTSAFMSLLKNLDHQKYDITVFALPSKNEANNINLDKIPSEIRTFLRVSAPPLSAKEKPVYEKGLVKGYLLDEKKLEVLKRIMQREYMRILGGAQFDYIIDFSGYSLYFPLLVTLGCQNSNTKKYIWQHNDLKSDFSNQQKRELNKTKVSLEALMSSYDKFDKIVSATESVYEINKENLATETTKDKFTFATNLLDKERFERLNNDKLHYIENGNLCIISEVEPNGFKRITSIPLKEGSVKFVTMGRLMPEKNHANIISAIKRLKDDGINASLYIIGDGHLREALESHAEALGISDRIIITGVLDNPFILLKQCDCFVFPSLYEAQGLAAIEAQMVGLPIILSNFRAVKSVVFNDNQYILKGFEADDIYEGLKAYISGEVTSENTFEIDAYNRKSINEFVSLLD